MMFPTTGTLVVCGRCRRVLQYGLPPASVVLCPGCAAQTQEVPDHPADKKALPGRAASTRVGDIEDRRGET